MARFRVFNTSVHGARAYVLLCIEVMGLEFMIIGWQSPTPNHIFKLAFSLIQSDINVFNLFIRRFGLQEPITFPGEFAKAICCPHDMGIVKQPKILLGLLLIETVQSGDQGKTNVLPRFVSSPKFLLLFLCLIVAQEFAKIAVNIIFKGDVAAKGYAKAANTLQVTVDAVDQGVKMLCDIFIRGAQSNLSSIQMNEFLTELGFHEETRECLVDYFAQRLKDMRSLVAVSKLNVPSYRKLEWRLDVQVVFKASSDFPGIWEGFLNFIKGMHLPVIAINWMIYRQMQLLTGSKFSSKASSELSHTKMQSYLA
eukprot:Gb_11880 [translate_table: standard]